MTLSSAQQSKSAAQLNIREVEIVGKLDPQVQDNWRQQRALKQALLGYATLDLVEHSKRLVFGLWNNRPINAPHVKRLLLSFEQDGLERFDEKTVIPIVLKKSLVDPSSLTQDIADRAKLPELKIYEEGNDSLSIPCAGGRHRMRALEDYLENIRKKEKEVQKKRSAISNIADEALTEEDISYYNKESVKQLQHLGGILKYNGRWLVAVYDESKHFLFCFVCNLISYLSSIQRCYLLMGFN